VDRVPPSRDRAIFAFTLPFFRHRATERSIHPPLLHTKRGVKQLKENGAKVITPLSPHQE
jgi:hypothetical protein